MTGILIISHFTLAQSVKETAELIIGRRENVEALSLNKNDRVEDFTEKLKTAVNKLDSGGGVLILADMFGGTPCNAAMSLYATDESVAVITGFNLPVAVDAIMHSSKAPGEIVKAIMEKREKTIVDAKAVFRKR